jgi:hypothetical protein
MIINDQDKRIDIEGLMEHFLFKNVDWDNILEYSEFLDNSENIKNIDQIYTDCYN